MPALTLALVQIRQSIRSMALRELIGASLIPFFMVLGVGLFYRKTLLGNRFHHYMWLLCMTTLTESLLLRLCALKLGMPPTWLFPCEMIMAASNVTIGGWLILRWLLWLPAVPLTAAALCIFDVVPLHILWITYVFNVILVAIGWSRAAGQARPRLARRRSE